MHYKPKEIANMTGVSSSSVKNYVNRHGTHFSPFATPEPGKPRYFTLEDAEVMAFIASLSRQGVTHDDIAERLAAGELDGFVWEPPQGGKPSQDAPQESQEGPEPTAALVVWQQFTQQLEAARAREVALQDRLIEAEARAARAEGELAALKRPFWRRWFDK